ncbi:MAG: shikimate dehydrogenase [Chloroherpetonaceae bacterium]|nr:shikimate dehydrogenase [Chloroherpetonaceae bacterium]
MSQAKKILGLIGHEIDYSLSPLMHNTAAEALGLDVFYTIFDVYPPENLSDALYGIRALDIMGVNVTIPYKEQVVRYMDSLSAEASEVRAVNTILNHEGNLIGYNTDIYGFSEPLKSYKDQIEGHAVAVYGTGGAARAVVQALKQYFNPSKVYILARDEGKGGAFVDRFKRRSKNMKISAVEMTDESVVPILEECRLIVNSTPIGTHHHSPSANQTATAITKPDPLVLPEWKIWNSDKIAYDLVYRPQMTDFLSVAKKEGAQIVSGLEMLIHQGAKSFEIWTGKEMPIEKVRAILLAKLDEQAHTNELPTAHLK